MKSNRPRSRKWVFFLLAFGMVFVGLLLFVQWKGLNFFRKPIVNALSHATGLNVEVESLSLGFAEGLGIQCNGIVVHAPKDGKQIFTARAVKLNLDWPALFERQIKIHQALLIHPSFTVHLGSEKKFEPPAAVPEVEEVLPHASPPVGQVLAPSPPEEPIESPDKPERDGLGKWVEQFQLNIGKLKVREANIRWVREPDSENTAREISTQMSADIAMARSAQGRIKASFTNAEITLGTLKVKSHVTGTDLLGNDPTLNIHGEIDSLKPQDLQFLETVLPDKAKRQIRKLSWSGTVHKIVWDATTPLKRKPDFEFFRRNSHGTYSFQLENLSPQLRGFPLTISNGVSRGQWKDHQLSFHNEGSTAGGRFESEGNLNLEMGANGLYHTGMETRIVFTAIELGKILPNDSKWKSAGTVSGEAQIRGRLAEGERLNMQGSFNGPSILFDNTRTRASFKNASLQFNGEWPRLIKTGNFQGDFKFASSLLQLTHDKIPIDLEQVSGTAQKRGNTLNHEVTAQTYNGQVKSSGTLHLFTGSKVPRIRTHIDFTDIDLSRIALPKGFEWTPQAGKSNGSVDLRGTIDRIDHLELVNGQAAAEGVIVTDSSNEISIQTIQIKAKTLRPQQSDIEVQAQNVQTPDLPFRKIQLKGRAQPGKFDILQGLAEPLHGTIRFRGNFIEKSGQYVLDFDGQGLHLEDYVQRYLQGPARVKGHLQGDWYAAPRLRGLSGNIGWEANQGQLRELEGYQNLLNLINAHAIASIKNEGLKFDFLGGDIFFQQGEATSNNLRMEGPSLQFESAGKVDLVREQIIAEVKVIPLQLVEQVTKAIPLLGDLLTQGGKRGVIQTYFSVAGDVSRPKIALIPGKQLLGKPVEELQRTIQWKSARRTANGDVR